MVHSYRILEDKIAKSSVDQLKGFQRETFATGLETNLKERGYSLLPPPMLLFLPFM